MPTIDTFTHVLADRNILLRFATARIDLHRHLPLHGILVGDLDTVSVSREITSADYENLIVATGVDEQVDAHGVLLGRRLGDHHPGRLALGRAGVDGLDPGLGQDRRLFRLAGLEQVGNTRQTTGNITGFTDFARYLYQHISGINFLLFGNLQK